MFFKAKKMTIRSFFYPYDAHCILLHTQTKKTPKGKGNSSAGSGDFADQALPAKRPRVLSQRCREAATNEVLLAQSVGLARTTLPLTPPIDQQPLPQLTLAPLPLPLPVPESGPTSPQPPLEQPANLPQAEETTLYSCAFRIGSLMSRFGDKLMQAARSGNLELLEAAVLRMEAALNASEALKKHGADDLPSTTTSECGSVGEEVAIPEHLRVSFLPDVDHDEDADSVGSVTEAFEASEW